MFIHNQREMELIAPRARHRVDTQSVQFSSVKPTEHEPSQLIRISLQTAIHKTVLGVAAAAVATPVKLSEHLRIESAG